MNVLLSHVDLQPLFYGVIIIIGILVVISHVMLGKFGAVVLDISLFILVFWMHGGSMNGGMAAAVAALIGSMAIPGLIKLILWYRSR